KGACSTQETCLRGACTLSVQRAYSQLGNGGPGWRAAVAGVYTSSVPCRFLILLLGVLVHVLVLLLVSILTFSPSFQLSLMSSLYLKYGEMNADIGVIRGEDVPRPGGRHTTKERSADDRGGVDMLKGMNEG